MNRSLVAQVVLALVVSGCGAAAGTEAAAPVAKVAKRESNRVKESANTAKAKEEVLTRRVGDFFVHRFTGSFTKAPMMLTEEVVGREDDAWVVDYTLEDGSGATRIRVREDSRSGAVLRVATLDAGGEKEAPLEVFEVLLARTSFAADENAGLIDRAARTCVVGPSELDCETKSYRVLVGDKEATLSVSASDAVRGRDIGGEITAADGSLIYRAEIVEMGRQKVGGRANSGVAAK